MLEITGFLIDLTASAAFLFACVFAAGFFGRKCEAGRFAPGGIGEQ